MPRNARTASVKTRLMLIVATAVAGVFIGSTAAQATSAGSVTTTTGAVSVTAAGPGEIDIPADDDNTPWG